VTLHIHLLPSHISTVLPV